MTALKFVEINRGFDLVERLRRLRKLRFSLGLAGYSNCNPITVPQWFGSLILLNFLCPVYSCDFDLLFFFTPTLPGIFAPPSFPEPCRLLRKSYTDGEGLCRAPFGLAIYFSLFKLPPTLRLPFLISACIFFF